jgi:hypothetical protein
MNDGNRTPEHVIAVESTQIYRGEVPTEMAEFLTNEGTKRNIYGEEINKQGPSLDFVEERKIIYECSCGKRFRKGKTAREHLEKKQ